MTEKTTPISTPGLIASIVAPSPVAKDKKRPWYAVKRILGTTVGIVGGAMVATGGTLVVATVASIPISVATIGWVVVQGGMAIFGYGWGSNNQKISDAK